MAPHETREIPTRTGNLLIHPPAPPGILARSPIPLAGTPAHSPAPPARKRPITTQAPELEPPPPPPPPRSAARPPDGPDPHPLRLNLTDFVDLATLQEVQDAFASITRLNTTILDADGRPVTVPTDTAKRDLTDQVMEQLVDPDTNADAQGRFAAPIIVEGQPLGSIVIEPTEQPEAVADRAIKVDELARSLGLDHDQTEQLLAAADQALGTNRGAAIQFLYLIANTITRLCYETYQSRQRLDELSVLYKISNALAGNRTLEEVLDSASVAVAELLQVKAVVIRLLRETPEGPELQRRANTGLSEAYINKGRLLVNRSELFTKALRGETVFIEDMPTDPRVFYPQQAVDEGLKSMLCVGILYQSQPIGTLQLFTGEPRVFTLAEVNLIRAIAPLLATAIEKTRLDAARRENQDMQRQLRLAADVQRRMLPKAAPDLTGYDIAARYVPSVDLSGDFYDFIRLDHSIGIGIGDVVGKGIAASLLMAGVRASLRAFAQDLYDLDEVIERVNHALCRDTLESEFVTLWYGVLDPTTHRLTYCNAGHEPPLLLRGSALIPLDEGGMIIGVDPAQRYTKGILDLRVGDTILLYTDGLPDAMDADGHRLGRERVEQLLTESAHRTAAEMLSHILFAIRQHTGPRRASDDLTLVVMKAVAR